MAPLNCVKFDPLIIFLAAIGLLLLVDALTIKDIRAGLKQQYLAAKEAAAVKQGPEAKVGEPSEKGSQASAKSPSAT